MGNRAGQAVTLNNIGGGHESAGQLEQALEYYRQSLSIREEVGDRGGVATTLNNIGMIYSRTGQLEQALEYYGRALPILEEVGNRMGQAGIRQNIAMIYLEQRRLEEAARELRTIVELDELIRSPDLESHRGILEQLEKALGS